MAGQPITITLPSLGAAGPTYASQINTAIGTLETELERKVVPADMDISTDVSFLSGATNSAVTDLKLAGFALKSESTLTAASYPMSLFAGSSDGELYWNDNSGRQIQITTNGTVNVSTTGGITGSGYGTSGAEVNWQSGTSTYHFYSAAATYATVQAGPATFTGAVTAQTTLGVTGLITATAGATAAANQHFTVSGTGKFKHGSRTYMIPGVGFAVKTPATDSAGYSDDGGAVCSSTTNVTFMAPILLPAGARITNVVFHADHQAGASNRTYAVKRNIATTNTTSDIFNTTDATDGAVVAVDSGALTATLVAGSSYYLYVTLSESLDTLRGVEITYDQP